jgi:hypothetical protein
MGRNTGRAGQRIVNLVDIACGAAMDAITSAAITRPAGWFKPVIHPQSRSLRSSWVAYDTISILCARTQLVVTQGARISINVIANGYHLQFGDMNNAPELFLGTNCIWRVCQGLLRITDLIGPVESKRPDRAVRFYQDGWRRSGFALLRIVRRGNDSGGGAIGTGHR